MSCRILVAGIGNIFMGDDAFGVTVAGRLAECVRLPEVRIVDFGIRTYDLAYALMDDWELVILVDSLPRGAEPGTLYTLEPDPVEVSSFPNDLDAHTLDPLNVLRLVGALGGKVGRLLVVGCEPASVTPDTEGVIGLSAPVNAAVDEAVRMVEDLIDRARSGATAA